MIEFNGKQVCSKCGKEYEWNIVKPTASGEVVVGKMDQMYKNVKNCTRVNTSNKYVIEIECPECWHRDFVEETV